MPTRLQVETILMLGDNLSLIYGRSELHSSINVKEGVRESEETSDINKALVSLNELHYGQTPPQNPRQEVWRVNQGSHICLHNYAPQF